MQLEWFAINYHNNNTKSVKREITSLNSTCAELNGSGCEDRREQRIYMQNGK